MSDTERAITWLEIQATNAVGLNNERGAEIMGFCDTAITALRAQLERDSAPAIAPVRGEWMAFDKGNPERPYNWICSECDGGCVDNRTKYCPDCGSKMGGEG